MFEIKRDERGPLRIDDRFLEGLRALSISCTEIIIKENDARHQKSLDEYSKSLESFEDESKKYLLESYENRYRPDRISPNFNISFKGGIRISTTNFDEFIKRIEEEPDYIESISMNIRAYGILNQNLSIEERFYSSARIEVETNEDQANKIYISMNRLLKSAEPSMPFIHGIRFRFICAVFAWAISYASFSFMMTKYIQANHLNNSIIIYLSYAVIGLIVAALSNFTSSKLKSIFPKVDFAIGHGLRRNVGVRSFWAWMAAVVIFPVLFLILGLILA